MKLNNEMKIGVMVVASIALLLVLTIRTGNFMVGEKGYEIEVTFLNVDGIEVNGPVILSGLEVGVIKDIRIVYGDDTKMVLTLWLKDKAKIREGSKAFVKNMGLMGEKYISLSAGDAGAKYLEPGATIMGTEPTDFDKLIAKGSDIADNLKEITENINERLKVNSEGIDETIANIRVASKNIASLTGNIDERLKVNQDNIDTIAANLSITSKNLEELSEDLKENPWKLLYRAKEKKTEK